MPIANTLRCTTTTPAQGVVLQGLEGSHHPLPTLAGRGPFLAQVSPTFSPNTCELAAALAVVVAIPQLAPPQNRPRMRPSIWRPAMISPTLAVEAAIRRMRVPPPRRLVRRCNSQVPHRWGCRICWREREIIVENLQGNKINENLKKKKSWFKGKIRSNVFFFIFSLIRIIGYFKLGLVRVN